MNKSISTVFFLGFFVSLCFTAKAWGVLGHRIVGEIADSYLTAKAKTEIKKILGNESVAMSSNWADFIKSDTSFRYLSNWHYINIDKGMTPEQLREYFKKDTATDLYTRINFLVKELKNKKLPLEKKRMYLRLLIHFVGDVHQPLHAGHKDDQGGNKVKVTWFNTPTNLHAVWDESLVNFQQLSYTEYAKAINHTTARQRKQWQAQPLSEWLIESYNTADGIYSEIKEDNQKLWYDYNFRHVDTVNERLLKGGVRLAGLLNSIFK
jgi:hypothetical protein